MPINFCVDTITALLQDSLPPPKGSVRQEGFGGWWYSLAEVGGSTPPPGKKAGGHPAYLWCLQWWDGQPPPKPGLTSEQIQELLSRPPGVHSLPVPETLAPKKDGSYRLYYHLQKLGHYEEVTSPITEGELTLKTTKKDYKLTEEAIAAIKEKVEQRRNHAKLVKLVMENLGIGKRAAQKRVRCWVEAGKT